MTSKNDLRQKLKTLPREVLVDIIYSSLDYMQQYNGRTKEEAILLALGVSEMWDLSFLGSVPEILKHFGYKIRMPNTINIKINGEIVRLHPLMFDIKEAEKITFWVDRVLSYHQQRVG